MPRYELSREAERELYEIGRYTYAEWGKEQRDAYLRLLTATFKKLADKPELARDCSYVREGYRKYGVGRHIVFFTHVENGIRIVRILHDRMDDKANL